MSGGEATMELLRTITYQPAAGTKMCEQALGKACGGDSKKKRPQQPSEDGQLQAQVTPAAPHHHHHHSHSGPEISRIIVDPTTGKRYCRGKVLGKVRSGGRQAAVREGGLPGQAERAGTPRRVFSLLQLSGSPNDRRGFLSCPPGLLCADSAGARLCIISLFSSRVYEGGLKAFYLGLRLSLPDPQGASLSNFFRGHFPPFPPSTPFSIEFFVKGK